MTDEVTASAALSLDRRLGASVTGWTWVADGWRACEMLLMGIAGAAVLRAYQSSRK